MAISPIKSVMKNSFSIIKAIRSNMLKELKKPGTYYESRKKQDPKWFRREFATVKISLPRRMGNTTLALKCFEFQGFRADLPHRGNNPILSSGKSPERKESIHA